MPSRERGPGGAVTNCFAFKAGFSFVLASLLPLLLAGFAALSKVESDLVAQTLARHGELIERVVSTLEHRLGQHAEEVEALAARLEVRSLRERPARAAMEAFLEHHPAFAEVGLAGRDGELVTSCSREPSHRRSLTPASSPELRGMIQRALSTRRTGTSLSTGPGPVEVLFVGPVAPYVRTDEPRAVVVARLEVHTLDIRELTGSWKLTGGTYLLITDRGGRVIAFAGRKLARKVESIRVTEHAAPHASVGERRILTGVAAVLGRSDVVATSSLPRLGLEIVVGRPYSELSRAIDELIAAVRFHVVAGALLALVLGILLSRSLVTPVLELTDGIHRVARGEVAHRVGAERADELGQAALAFNHMAAELQKGRLLETVWTTLRADGARRPGEGG